LTDRLVQGGGTGHKLVVFIDLVHRFGLRGWHLHLGSLAAVYLCIALWIRAKTHDQSERGNAERRALFVGLWPPMLWLIGDSLELREQRRPVRRRSTRIWGTAIRR
jgi:hypothetical protein